MGRDEKYWWGYKYYAGPIEEPEPGSRLEEHFAGLHLPEEVSSLDDNLYITLTRHGHDVRQSAQVVLARLNRSDFKLALTVLQSAAQSAPTDAALQFELAQAQFSVGNPVQAQVSLRNSLE